MDYEKAAVDLIGQAVSMVESSLVCNKQDIMRCRKIY